MENESLEWLNKILIQNSDRLSSIPESLAKFPWPDNHEENRALSNVLLVYGPPRQFAEH